MWTSAWNISLQYRGKCINGWKIGSLQYAQAGLASLAEESARKTLKFQTSEMQTFRQFQTFQCSGLTLMSCDTVTLWAKSLSATWQIVLAVHPWTILIISQNTSSFYCSVLRVYACIKFHYYLGHKSDAIQHIPKDIKHISAACPC